MTPHLPTATPISREVAQRVVKPSVCRARGATSIPADGPRGRYRSRVEIVPDTKDWTWVLTRPCPECGLDAAAIRPAEVAGLIRDNARRWQGLLAAPDVRRRPAPAVWSALEYGCHVRDVYALFDERLRLMLADDDPLFANWDQDETAVAKAYGDDDPDAVAAALAEEADRIAARFDGVEPAQWGRTGRRSDGARFTVETFAQYLLHDVIHHVDDVERAGA